MKTPDNYTANFPAEAIVTSVGNPNVSAMSFNWVPNAFKAVWITGIRVSSFKIASGGQSISTGALLTLTSGGIQSIPGQLNTIAGATINSGIWKRYFSEQCGFFEFNNCGLRIPSAQPMAISLVSYAGEAVYAVGDTVNAYLDFDYCFEIDQ